MTKNSISEMLRTALVSVPEYRRLPECPFPTLPILEATEFGQQRIVTTFSLGAPPPATVVTHGEFAPAVSLCIVMPEGYSYWQPETGTGDYIGGVPQFAQLPEMYAEVVRQCIAALPASPTFSYSPARCQQYLLALEQLVKENWLLHKSLDHDHGHDREKKLATVVDAQLRQLVAPELYAYYHTRGQALYAWIKRVTYEKNWVEAATDGMRHELPTWTSEAAYEADEVRTTHPIPAVLDGRQCVLTAFYRVASCDEQNNCLIYPPHHACCMSYPEMETVWQPLPAIADISSVAAFIDENKRPYLGKTKAEFEGPATEEAVKSYQRLVTLLLQKGWLMTRHAATQEEQQAARYLRECVEILYHGPLKSYYHLKAWQFLGWMRRVIGEN